MPTEPPSALRPRAPRRLRGHTLVLVPTSLLLLAALAAITLLSYRSAVTRLVAERQESAAKLASRLASTARERGLADQPALALALPPGAAAAIYAPDGTERWSLGFAGPAERDRSLPAPTSLAEPRVQGPDGEVGDVVRALAPFAAAGGRWVVRLELPAPTLAGPARSLAILTPLVFGLSAAIALLTVFFLRTLTRPYDEMLARAREAGSPAAAGGDVDFLLATFDRALAALAAPTGNDLVNLERALGDQIENGLLLFDRAGRLLAANPAAAELLGGLRLAPGSAVDELLASQPALRATLAPAVAAARSLARATARVTHGAGTRDLGLTVQALGGVGGAEPRGTLVLFADITDFSRREAEARLGESLAQLGELSAGVAHELRNSLATLAGYLELIARRELPPAARTELGEARRETQALARVVDDFLAFARPSSGPLAPLDLVALVERAVADPALGGAAVELTVEGAPLATTGDPQLLQRALRNLLLNAVEASRERGGTPVEVHLGRTADQAQITIADRGPGIPAEILSRLFQPFASARPGGAGLGLALARRIVLLHGGELELVNRDGGGAIARLRLRVVTSAT